MRNNWLKILSSDHDPYLLETFESEPPLLINSKKKTGADGLFFENNIENSSYIHASERRELRMSLTNVMQCTRNFLSWLVKGTSQVSDKCECDLESENGNCETSFCSWNSSKSFSYATSNSHLKPNGREQAIPERQVGQASSGVALSFIPSRILATMTANIWYNCKNSWPFSTVDFEKRHFPSLDNMSSNRLQYSLHDVSKDLEGGVGTYQKSICDRSSLELWDTDPISSSEVNNSKNVVEPRTGRNFPTTLPTGYVDRCYAGAASQVLVGFGSKCITIAKVKTLSVYAFGLYVHPLSACKALSERYCSLRPEDLKARPEFFDDLLRQDMQMTLRLVVHYKGLKLATVRNVFETSLRNRLGKIQGDVNVSGLSEFCGYFSKDISLSPGTIIDFHRLPGGLLRTEISGKEIGTIQSSDFCRAFFDMYIGDSPVSLKAKEDVGRNIVQVLKKC